MCNFFKDQAKNRAGQFDNKKCKLIIQRYIPATEETNWLIRVHWKMNSGFKLYRYTNQHKFNSENSINFEVLNDMYDNIIQNLDKQKIENQVSEINHNRKQQL